MSLERAEMKEAVIAGGTGYIGRPLIERLCAGGFHVKAISRPRSLSRLPSGCQPVIGSVLDATSYEEQIPIGSTFIHLVGVPHPAPWKSAQFRAVDLVSLKQSVAAAKHRGVNHFVYMSVAHPAPVMNAYIQVRTECEEIVRESGMNATILRPWYVLGPGHRWPVALKPVYEILRWFPATRESALRLGLVTREQVVSALYAAADSDANGLQVLETGAIRASGCAERVRT
jgi:uncharacterized protein YbjT (DUF2867 family)